MKRTPHATTFTKSHLMAEEGSGCRSQTLAAGLAGPEGPGRRQRPAPTTGTQNRFPISNWVRTLRGSASYRRSAPQRAKLAPHLSERRVRRRASRWVQRPAPRGADSLLKTVVIRRIHDSQTTATDADSSLAAHPPASVPATAPAHPTAQQRAVHRERRVHRSHIQIGRAHV